MGSEMCIRDSISSVWDIKEPTHYWKRVGHEVLGVVAVLCEWLGGVGEVNMD